MRKVLFLMFLLLLLGLGAASVKAQVRIGGNTPPSAAAVLDLNATDATNNGTGGFTLPRVSLASNTAQLNSTTPITGMLVYNTNATLGVGIYFYNGSNWVPIDGDGVIGNELTDTIAGGGLTKSGAGTAASPYKVGIKTGGITTGMIADKAVTGAKIATVESDTGRFLTSNGTTVVWSALFGGGYTNTATLRAQTPRTPVITVILDSTISVQLRLNAYVSISAPGINRFDMCHVAGLNAMSTVTTNTNMIYLFAHVQTQNSMDLRFVCLRPTY